MGGQANGERQCKATVMGYRRERQCRNWKASGGGDRCITHGGTSARDLVLRDVGLCGQRPNVSFSGCDRARGHDAPLFYGGHVITRNGQAFSWGGHGLSPEPLGQPVHVPAARKRRAKE